MIFRKTLETASRIDRTLDRLDDAVSGIIRETQSILEKIEFILAAISTARKLAQAIEALAARSRTIAAWAARIPSIGPGVASFLRNLAVTFGPAAKNINAALDKVSAEILAAKLIVPRVFDGVGKLDPRLGPAADVLDAVLNAARTLEPNQPLIERFLPAAYRESILRGLRQLDGIQGNVQLTVAGLEGILAALKTLNGILGGLQAALDAKNKALAEVVKTVTGVVDAIETELDNLTQLFPEGLKDLVRFLLNKIKLAVLQAQAEYLRYLARLFALVNIDLRAVLRRLNQLYSRTTQELQRKAQDLVEALVPINALSAPFKDLVASIVAIEARIAEAIGDLNRAIRQAEALLTLLLGIARWKSLAEAFLPIVLPALRRALEKAEKELRKPGGGDRASLRAGLRQALDQARLLERETAANPLAPIRLASLQAGLSLSSAISERLGRLDRILDSRRVKRSGLSPAARERAFGQVKDLRQSSAALEAEIRNLRKGLTGRLPRSYFDLLGGLLEGGGRGKREPSARVPVGLDAREIRVALSGLEKDLIRLPPVPSF